VSVGISESVLVSNQYTICMNIIFRAGALVLVGVLSLSTPVFAQTISEADLQEIAGVVSVIERGILETDKSMIMSVVADDARDSLDRDIFYGLPFRGDVKSIHISDATLVPEKSSGDLITYNALLDIDADGYKGQSTHFFSFKKEQGKWYLYDTDFYKGLGSKFSSKFSDGSGTSSSTDAAQSSDGDSSSTGFLGGLALLLGLGGLLIIVPIVLFVLVSAFWLWMLIESCVRKDYHNKPFWILINIFFGVVGTLFYYFMEHRSYKKQQKLELASAVAPAATAPAVAPAATLPDLGSQVSVAPAPVPEATLPDLTPQTPAPTPAPVAPPVEPPAPTA